MRAGIVAIATQDRQRTGPDFAILVQVAPTAASSPSPNRPNQCRKARYDSGNANQQISVQKDHMRLQSGAIVHIMFRVGKLNLPTALPTAIDLAPRFDNRYHTRMNRSLLLLIEVWALGIMLAAFTLTNLWHLLKGLVAWLL